MEQLEKSRTLSCWFFYGKPDGFPAKAKGRVRPDAVLSVRQKSNQSIHDCFFVAEVDCTSMPVVRGDQLEQKLKRALLDLREANSKQQQLAAKSQVDHARDKLLLHKLTSGQRSFLQKFTAYFWA